MGQLSQTIPIALRTLCLFLKSLEERVLLRRIIGNTIWQVSEKLLRMVLALSVGVWMARYLGPEQFGVLNFAIAYVALFSILSEAGLQAIVIRDLVMRPEDQRQIVASALALRLFGTIVAVALIWISIGILRGDDPVSRAVIGIVALSLLPQAWDVIDFDYQAQMRARPIAIVRSVSLVAFCAVRVSLIVAGAKLAWFAWAIVAELSLSALLMQLLAKSQLRSFRFSDACWKEMRHLLHDSWPLAVAGLSVILYMRIDQIMLGQMLSYRDVGVFSAAVRISEAWYLVPMAILAAVAPVLTAAHGAAAQSYEEKLVLFMRLMFCLGMTVALVFTLASHRLISILYGDGYSESGSVLALHAWAGVFASLGVASGPWFVNSGLLKYRMVHTMAGAAINICLNLYLIPHFGVVGAAASTVISQSMAALLFNSLARATRPLFMLQVRSVLWQKG